MYARKEGNVTEVSGQQLAAPAAKMHQARPRLNLARPPHGRVLVREPHPLGWGFIVVTCNAIAVAFQRCHHSLTPSTSVEVYAMAALWLLRIARCWLLFATTLSNHHVLAY